MEEDLKEMTIPRCVFGNLITEKTQRLFVIRILVSFWLKVFFKTSLERDVLKKTLLLLIKDWVHNSCVNESLT